MNKRTADRLTDAVLCDLDSAQTTVLTREERERADAMFTRILATPPNQVPEIPDRPRRRRSLILVGMVAAGAAIPAWLLGGGSAFASWTPKPEPLTGVAAAKVASACRAALEMPDNGEQVLHAERRGDWTYVLLASPQAEGACLMPDYLVEAKDLPEPLQGGFFGSYDPDPPEPPVVARGSIVETEAMEGSVSARGRLPFSTDEGWLTWVSGYLGSDVISVTVHPPVGPDVEASVEGGRYSGWWPSAVGNSKNLEVMGAWDYTVTLADGSTQRVTGRG